MEQRAGPLTADRVTPRCCIYFSGGARTRRVPYVMGDAR